MDSIAELLIAFIIGLGTWLSNLIFKIIAKLLSLIGITIRRDFLRKIMIFITILITAYLLVGYVLIKKHSIDAVWMEIVFSNWKIYPALALNLILWLGIIGGIGKQVNFLEKEDHSSEFGSMLFAFFVTILTLVAVISFFTAKSNYWQEEARLIRIAECEAVNTETTGTFDKIADKLKLDGAIKDFTSDLLKEKCE